MRGKALYPPAGATALALAAAGPGRPHCVDPDIVELSTPKIGAATARLRELNSDIVISVQRSRICSADDVLPLCPGESSLRSGYTDSAKMPWRTPRVPRRPRKGSR
jgi:hypothetical protein